MRLLRTRERACKVLPGLAVAAILAVLPPLAAEAQTTSAPGKIPLKVLYVGQSGSERAKEFAEFLRGHFTEVGTGDFTKFVPSQADGFDVVVLDYDGRDYAAPRPALPKTYTRATVTVGVPGADICGALGLKTGYQ